MVAADKLEIFFNEKWYVGVNASDMFYFASSDRVEIESNEALEALYRSCVADPKTGHVARASKARNMQPCRRCYIDPMKTAGTWTKELEPCPRGHRARQHWRGMGPGGSWQASSPSCRVSGRRVRFPSPSANTLPERVTE